MEYRYQFLFNDQVEWKQGLDYLYCSAVFHKLQVK